MHKEYFEGVRAAIQSIRNVSCDFPATEKAADVVSVMFELVEIADLDYDPTNAKNLPYLDFIHSSPDQLAEKLLKASCCYCVFGKGQGMGCRNKTGTDCKEGILAYLQGKTID